jgi:hypothetical protein
VKRSRLMILVLLVITLLSACSGATPTAVEVSLSALPTPDVPPAATIEAAKERWENSHISSYFVDIARRTQDSTVNVRLVLDNDQVRAAQERVKEESGEWSEPTALPLQEAEQYTIESLFSQVQREASSQGPVPMNLKVTFDPSLGYPVNIHAEALPAYNQEGKLVLNRAYNYDLTAEVKTLLEDTFGVGRDPIFSLIRSGGPEAWCDNLRIYSDGSSVYVDDCRQKVLQLSLSDNRLEELDNLRASFTSLDDTRQADNQFQHLIIQGTGKGEPDESTVEQAWDLAAIAHDLLSQPIGLGVTLVYTHNDRLLGFDTLNENTQPAKLEIAGKLRGVALSPDDQYLAFGDDTGLKYLDVQSGNTTTLLPAPEDGYYQPRNWGSAGFLLVTLVPGTDKPPETGWVSIAEPSWHALPLPEGVEGFGCDTGAEWSPVADQLAITGLAYAQACNMNPGLTLVDLSEGKAQHVVAPAIQSGEVDTHTLTAGAHTPAWSLDGDWIAFGLDQDASSPMTFPTRLYRVHPDGSDLTPLTNNSQGTAAYPVWAPDGSLYYSLSDVSVETDGIYRYDPSANQHTLMVNGTDLHPLSVSPGGEFLAYEQSGGLYLWGFIRQSATAVVQVEEGPPAEFVGWLTSEASKDQP